MMKTVIVASAAILCMSFAAAHAQNTSTPGTGGPFDRESWFNKGSDDLYRAGDFSLEAFGAASGEGDRNNFDDHWGHRNHDLRGGGGGGLEYFFVRYVGIEAETMALANRHDTESMVGGNLVLRLPIGQSGFAPYVFGGGGDEFTYRTEGYGEGGAGVEYRFNHHFGLFGDGRFDSPDHTRDFGLGRLGVRFTF